MASEILAVPEDHLEEVIYIIRRGLAMTKNDHKVEKETWELLQKWCDQTGA